MGRNLYIVRFEDAANSSGGLHVFVSEEEALYFYFALEKNLIEDWFEKGFKKNEEDSGVDMYGGAYRELHFCNAFGGKTIRLEESRVGRTIDYSL
jgi:hypothetical protein